MWYFFQNQKRDQQQPREESSSNATWGASAEVRPATAGVDVAPVRVISDATPVSAMTPQIAAQIPVMPSAMPSADESVNTAIESAMKDVDVGM